MRTTAELQKAINRTGFLRLDGFRIRVVVVDARQVWDRIDYLVAATGGAIGRKWVSADRVNLGTQEG